MSREEGGYVYILGSTSGRLYIGVTNSIERRVSEHKLKAVAGFTARYNINRLLYCEAYPDIESAIAREKEIKKWRREKKLALIEADNPDHRDRAAYLNPADD